MRVRADHLTQARPRLRRGAASAMSAGPVCERACREQSADPRSGCRAFPCHQPPERAHWALTTSDLGSVTSAGHAQDHLPEILRPWARGMASPPTDVRPAVTNPERPSPSDTVSTPKFDSHNAPV